MTASLTRPSSSGGSSALPRRLRALARLGLPAFALVFFLASHWPKLRLMEDVELPWLSLDKFAHVVGYATLAGLVVASGLGAAVGARLGGAASGASRWRAWFGTVLVCAVFALLDEGTQPFVGRQMTLPDLGADAVGVAVGLLSVWWVRRWWRLEFGATHGATDVQGTSASGEAGESFVGHASLVAGLTMVSRVTGLVRDAVLLSMFGASQVMSAFFFGFMVPNLFRRLFGEGALTAAFLPRYTRLLRDDPALAARYAKACGWSAVGIVTGLVVVGEVVLALVWWGLVAQATGPGLGAGKVGLAVSLTMLMLPYAPLICGVAFWTAVLQARGRFGPGAFAPVFLNVGMIVASGVAVLVAESDEARAMWVAAGVLVCGAMQAGLIGVAVRGEGPTVEHRGLRVGEETLSGVMRATLWTMGPMVVGLGVFQINTLLDGLIAYGLAAPEVPADGVRGLRIFGQVLEYPVGPGAMAELTAAQRLYQFPLGVFGIAIATAIFPALSAAGRSDQREQFSDIVRRGVRLTWFIGLPAAVGLVLVREPLTRVIFERGAFGKEDAAAVAWVLMGYGSAIWAYSLTHVLTRAFYARDDAKTPLIVAVGMVAVNVMLNLTLIWPLGAAGLAWSTAISATAQCLVLVTLLNRHADEPLGRGVMGGLGRTAIAAAVMAGMLLAVRSMNPDVFLSWAGALALLAVMVPVGAAAYLGTAMALRCAELRWLVGRETRGTTTD